MRVVPTVLGVLGLWLAGPGAAGADFADGARAYDGGDYATAFREWHELAAAGDTTAQTAIGGMYRFGEGRAPNFAMAASWYRRAAVRGEAVAQMNLGEMYLHGLGVPPDPIEAYVWFARAARQGRSWAVEQQRGLERRLTAAQRNAARRRLRDRSGRPAIGD